MTVTASYEEIFQRNSGIFTPEQQERLRGASFRP